MDDVPELKVSCESVPNEPPRMDRSDVIRVTLQVGSELRILLEEPREKVIMGRNRLNNETQRITIDVYDTYYVESRSRNPARTDMVISPV